VVDASVAIKLYLAEPLATEAQALFARLADPTTIFHIPDLFYIESANVLWKQVQRGSATATQVASHYAALAALPLQRTPTFDLAADALALAAMHGITAYDACYVALAQRHGIPLITADDKLVRKLAGSNCSVTWLGDRTPPAPTP
jgi:predicted nucleic acid-binding protein